MTRTSHSYYVVMIDYGRRGLEAIVDPELTKQNVIGRIASHEYDPEQIVFIHHVDGLFVEDVTADLMSHAGVKVAA
jgi:hypothetical protein